MKYNDNGEYKDIYVKTFDTLPIGTEVDYDGETVPAGWTEVSNKSWKFQMISRTVPLTANTGTFPGINYDSIQGTIICSFLIGVECTTDNGLLTQCVPAELRNNGIMTAISLKSSVNQTCTVRVGVIYTED